MRRREKIIDKVACGSIWFQRVTLWLTVGALCLIAFLVAIVLIALFIGTSPIIDR